MPLSCRRIAHSARIVTTNEKRLLPIPPFLNFFVTPTHVFSLQSYPLPLSPCRKHATIVGGATRLIRPKTKTNIFLKEVRLTRRKLLWPFKNSMHVVPQNKKGHLFKRSFGFAFSIVPVLLFEVQVPKLFNFQIVDRSQSERLGLMFTGLSCATGLV